jgi:cyclomaltodextrinase
MDTPKWVTDAVFYEIFPDRFARSDRLPKTGLNFEAWDSPPTVYGFKGGDLLGVIEHLDYLQDLGVNALYFTPVFASAANHRYHAYDYHQIDPLLGGNDALRELLEHAHQRHMHVILDGVFNHAGRGLWQFHHTLENGAASPYVDWFHFDPDRLQGRRHWGAYPSREELQAIQREGSFQAIGYQAWWDMPALPKFNTDTKAVRDFLLGVAEYWIRFGVDGWRLDVPGEINDDSFWQAFRTRVRAANPDAYIVGEIWSDARRWLQGDQFDASMNYQVTACLLSFLPGRHLDSREALRAGGYQGQIRPGDAQAFADRIDACRGLYSPEVTRVQLNLLDSHDTPRFLTCASGDVDSLRLALAFLFTYPGAPCLFYGDEIGMQGRHDPDCRRSFPWDEREWNQQLRDSVKALIALRSTQAALRWGNFLRLYSANGVYAFGRSLDGRTYVTALNAGEADQIVKLDLNAPQSRTVAMVWGSGSVRDAESLTLEIRARSAAIFSVESA